MQLSVYLLLSVFSTGYLFAVVHRDCGGTIDILREKSGYIHYSSTAGQVASNVITGPTYYNGLRQAKCTWIFEAPPNQKVRLDIVSTDYTSRLWVHFENSGDQMVYVPEESSSFSGSGTTIITWRAKQYGSSQQSIKIYFTDSEEMKNSSEWGRGESPRTAPAMYTEASSPNISGAPGAWRKSRLPESSVDSRGYHRRTIRARGLGMGHGMVAAFHSPTSAPTLWLSSSASVLSDKEAAPLPQEAPHNNPDTSGAALPVSHITIAPDQPTKGSGRRLDAAGPRRSSLATQTIENGPEPPPFLDASMYFSKHATSVLPPTQGVDTIFRSAVTRAAAPLSRTRTDSVTAIFGLHTQPPNMTAPAPLTVPPGQWTDTPGVTESHSVTSTVYSRSALTLLDSGHSPTAHLTTAFTESHSGKGSTHGDDRQTIASNIPGTGGQDVTEWPSFSASLPSSTRSLSEGQNGFLESTGTVGRGSRSVTHPEPVITSVSEGLTNRGTEQGSWVNGERHGTTERITDYTGAEGSSRLVTRSLSEGESADALPPDVSEKASRIPLSTDSSSGTALPPALGSVGISTGSADPAATHSEVASVTTRLGLDIDLHGSSSTSAATLITDLGKEGNAEFTTSVTSRVTSTRSPVNRHSTETLTVEPEIKVSVSPNDIHLTPVSVTAVPGVSPRPESEGSPAYKSGSSNSTSHPLSPGETDTRAAPAASTTAPTVTAGPQGGATEPEDISSDSRAHSTPDNLFKWVTTSDLPFTTSPVLSRGTSGTERPEEGVHSTSPVGHLEKAATSADPYFYRHTPTPVGSDTTSLIMTSQPPTVAPPTAGSPPTVRSTAGGSVSASSTLFTVGPQRLSTSVPGGTQGAQRRTGSPVFTTTASVSGGTSSSPVTSVPVTATVQPTSTVRSKTTHQTPTAPPPLTPWPRPTSQVSSPQTGPLPPRTELSTSRASTQSPSGRTPMIPSSTAKPVRGRVFIMQNQPAILKEETVRLLLQIVLDSGSRGEPESPQADSINMDAVQKVEPLLQRASGYEGLQVPWTSGRGVLQSVPVFGAARALSWLGAPGGLLDVTGLREAVREGLYLGGAKVVNITVGGLQADLCSWLFLCPSGFQCVPTGGGNASCTSLCHTDYCKNSGICMHHHGQQPMCQCPVGEDFWFMGRRCDLRMTRQRLVGVCLGVLLSVAVLMAVVSFLAVRRVKAMLIQAKVDQTRSSYRRFNHFDELSGRFWLRSWPGSADSLDNPGFSRSDELLHLRALDRTCCYHDDTLSIASTCPESGTHLNTVYTHGSRYNWDLSASSINEWMADSGKASDLSVCSWPIEPIQWTPFPLLQQLGIHRSVKTPRPHSYCEGMELVDLEKTWTT
ncbi:mucin-17 [Megalops cyprinoides]|uniref:mucin-17 n=1 Tax=Megalops cyprinoides TaxID=118141 RepID=UPI001863D29C|nr:mucin-17 [Megalops cyprinoides]